MFLVSLASPDKDIIWSDKGIEGSLRFINKLFEYFDKVKVGKSSKRSESKLNKTIKEVSSDIENLRYNLAVIKIRDLFDNLQDKESKDVLEKFLKLFSPFCPHISEELWHTLGNKELISLEKWPTADESKIDEKLEEQDRLIKKLNEDINNIFKIVTNKGKEVKKAFVYVLPKEMDIYDIKLMKIDLDVKIFSVSDKNKYDPENKAGKAKPGKPAIYLE